MSEIFDELKSEISKSGLSTETIAKLSNVHHVTVDAWLDGRVTRPHLETVEKVANALGLFVTFNGRQPSWMAKSKPQPKRAITLAEWLRT